MSGEQIYGAFCIGWLVVGGILLTIQLFSRLRGIERLRQIQSDEISALAQIEAEIKMEASETDEVELQARTLRRMIRMWEQKIEAASAVQVAAVVIPLARRTAIEAKLRTGPSFE